jgi:hypothetical protein
MNVFHADPFPPDLGRESKVAHVKPENCRTCMAEKPFVAVSLKVRRKKSRSAGTNSRKEPRVFRVSVSGRIVVDRRIL